jgi:hypothetical protein
MFVCVCVRARARARVVVVAAAAVVWCGGLEAGGNDEGWIARYLMLCVKS